MSKIKLSKNFIKNVVKLALNEDLYPSGDITSNLIKKKETIKIKLISNQNAIIGGLLFVKHAFLLIDNKIKKDLSKELLFGSLKNGGVVKVTVKGKELALDIGDGVKLLEKQA